MSWPVASERARESRTTLSRENSLLALSTKQPTTSSTLFSLCESAVRCDAVLRVSHRKKVDRVERNSRRTRTLEVQWPHGHQRGGGDAEKRSRHGLCESRLRGASPRRRPTEDNARQASADARTCAASAGGAHREPDGRARKAVHFACPCCAVFNPTLDGTVLEHCGR
jgi:hypothetical protein